MAINTLIEGNFLTIDKGTANEDYFSASRTDMDFTDEAVILTDLGKDGNRGRAVTIKFTDFQYDGTPYASKAAIFGALNTLIGS